MYHCLPKPARGNALSEYGLVGALILLVCIAGFWAVGGNLHDWLSNMKSDLSSRRDAALAASTKASTVATDAQNISQKLDKAMSPELMKDLTPEERAALGGSLASKLQTLGANGTTELMSRQLAELARQLLAEGKITPDQSGILMNMANQGFKIATVESLVEDATRMANGDTGKLKSLTFQYNGQTDNAYDLASKVGFNTHMPQDYANLNILTDNGNAQYEMADFLNFYNQAQAAGLLSDPQIKATVDSAATQIASTGESVETLLYTTFTNNSASIPSYDYFKSSIASNTSKMDSSRICTSGDFSTDGVSCSK